MEIKGLDSGNRKPGRDGFVAKDLGDLITTHTIEGSGTRPNGEVVPPTVDALPSPFKLEPSLRSDYRAAARFNAALTRAAADERQGDLARSGHGHIDSHRYDLFGDGDLFKPSVETVPHQIDENAMDEVPLAAEPAKLYGHAENPFAASPDVVPGQIGGAEQGLEGAVTTDVDVADAARADVDAAYAEHNLSQPEQ